MFDLRLPLFLSDGHVQIYGRSHRLTLKHALASGNLDYHNRNLVRRRGSRGRE
jgi:hypothetical protein